MCQTILKSWYFHSDVAMYHACWLLFYTAGIERPYNIADQFLKGFGWFLLAACMQALHLWTLLATYAVAVGQNQGQKNQECPKLNAQVLSFKNTRGNAVVMFSVKALSPDFYMGFFFQIQYQNPAY